MVDLADESEEIDRRASKGSLVRTGSPNAGFGRDPGFGDEPRVAADRSRESIELDQRRNARIPADVRQKRDGRQLDLHTEPRGGFELVADRATLYRTGGVTGQRPGQLAVERSPVALGISQS